jgi:tetratricopeptide (TPR) repeat protein
MNIKIFRITYLLLLLITSCSQPIGINEYIQQELAAEKAGDLDEAIKICSKILEIDPHHASTIATISGLYGEKGEFEKQVFWAKRAIDYENNNINAYINLGNGLAGLDKINEAEEAYNKAILLNPDSPFGYFSLGVLTEMKGDINSAIKYYKKATDKNPTFMDALFNLAAAQANIGNFGEASINLKKVLELTPDSKDAKEMLIDIQTEIELQKKL